MLKKKNKRKTDNLLPVHKIIYIAVSGFAGTVITLLLTLIFSAVLVKSPTLPANGGIYFLISVIIGGFICGIISSRKTKMKGIIAGALSSIFFSLFIFTLMLIFSHGQLAPQTVVLALIMIIICIVGEYSAQI